LPSFTRSVPRALQTGSFDLDSFFSAYFMTTYGMFRFVSPYLGRSFIFILMVGCLAFDEKLRLTRQYGFLTMCACRQPVTQCFSPKAPLIFVPNAHYRPLFILNSFMGTYRTGSESLPYPVLITYAPFHLVVSPNLMTVYFLGCVSPVMDRFFF